MSYSAFYCLQYDPFIVLIQTCVCVVTSYCFYTCSCFRQLKCFRQVNCVRRDQKVSPGQLGNKVSPTCPRSSLGPPPSGTSQEHLLEHKARNTSPGRHPGGMKQMPGPPQLTPLNVEKRRLYSKLLPGN